MKKTILSLTLILAVTALSAQTGSWQERGTREQYGRGDRYQNDRYRNDRYRDYRYDRQRGYGRDYGYDRFRDDDRHYDAYRQNRARDYRDVRLFEVELGVGSIGGMFHDNYIGEGASIYVEPRFNIPGSPLDVGAQLSTGYLDYHHPRYGYNHDDFSVKYYNMSFVTMVDYNWRNWRQVSLFAGLGLGVAMMDYENTYYYLSYWDSGYSSLNNDYSQHSVVLNPRFGVELWGHLRLTADYKLMKDDYSYGGITVGVSFGGGRRR